MSRIQKSYDVIIAGAGVAGLATARSLSAIANGVSVALISEHAPVSYTSSLSTECFRDHWPSEVMRGFMKRSISLLEDFATSGPSSFGFTRRGYLYVTGDNGGRGVADLSAEASLCHRNVRTHRGAAAAADYFSHKTGADVLADAASVQAHFPYLSSNVGAALHARNAGWLSAHSMGTAMLEQLQTLTARDGRPLVQLIRGSVTAVDAGPRCDGVRSVRVALPDGTAAVLECGAFVNATGPFLNRTHLSMFPSPDGPQDVAASAPDALPVFSEVHAKVIFRDTLGVIPRDAPMVIGNDLIELPWTAEERAALVDVYGEAAAQRLQSELPAGVHFRTYGGEASDAVLMLWECWHHGVQPSDPPAESVDALLDRELYPEVVLRGLSRLVPDLAAYFDPSHRLKSRGSPPSGGHRRPLVDGGYYTKTRENLPLIGPAPGRRGEGTVRGAFVCGALSGYGIMASHAAGELAALHVAGSRSLPPYAALMDPRRYSDPDFTRPGGVRDQLLAAGGGQL